MGRGGPARGGPASQTVLAMAEMAGSVWLCCVITPHSAKIARRPVSSQTTASASLDSVTHKKHETRTKR